MMNRRLLPAVILFLIPVIGTLSCSVEEGDDFDLWTRSYLLPMDDSELKTAGASDVISIRVTPEEYEPAVFAVRATVDQEVSVTILSQTASWTGQASKHSDRIRHSFIGSLFNRLWTLRLEPTKLAWPSVQNQVADPLPSSVKFFLLRWTTVLSPEVHSCG